MTDEAAKLLASMRNDGWTIFSEDARVFYVVARDVAGSVVQELWRAGKLDAVRGFPRGWHYSAKPERNEQAGP